MWFDSETTEKQRLALCYKWLHRLRSDQIHGFISQSNRHGGGVLTLAGDCASDPSAEERGKEEGGRNQGISWELHQQQHNSNIVAPTDPSKKTLDPEFSTSCCLPRSENPVLTSVAAQHSQQQSNKVIYAGPCTNLGPEWTRGMKTLCASFHLS